MKIKRDHYNQQNTGVTKPLENGSAVVVFLALLAIMLILVTAESRSLLLLHREVKLIERQEIKRLNTSQTNTVTIEAITQ